MGDGGKIELQDKIHDMTLTTIFINCKTLGGWGTGQKKLQDLIPDMTLTTIFINCMTLGGWGTGAK